MTRRPSSLPSPTALLSRALTCDLRRQVLPQILAESWMTPTPTRTAGPSAPRPSSPRALPSTTLSDPGHSHSPKSPHAQTSSCCSWALMSPWWHADPTARAWTALQPRGPPVLLSFRLKHKLHQRRHVDPLLLHPPGPTPRLEPASSSSGRSGGSTGDRNQVIATSPQALTTLAWRPATGARPAPAGTRLLPPQPMSYFKPPGVALTVSVRAASLLRPENTDP